MGGDTPPSRRPSRDRETLEGEGGAAQHAELCGAPANCGLAGPRPPVQRLRGTARPAGAAGHRDWNAKRPSYTECSPSDSHCIPGAAPPSWRRPSRQCRNGFERSPRREGKAAMEQAGRRTQVRAAPRSLPRPRQPFPQHGTRPVGERQDMQEERHERGA